MPKKQWVIICDDGTEFEQYVIGPFKTHGDACAYRDTDPEAGHIGMLVREMKRPARAW